MRTRVSSNEKATEEFRMEAIEQVRQHDRRGLRRSRRPVPQATTYFDHYTNRLRALAERHGVQHAAFRALIEGAFGTNETAPTIEEARESLMKLARLRVGPAEINFLFQYHVVEE